MTSARRARLSIVWEIPPSASAYWLAAEKWKKPVVMYCTTLYQPPNLLLSIFLQSQVFYERQYLVDDACSWTDIYPTIGCLPNEMKVLADLLNTGGCCFSFRPVEERMKGFWPRISQYGGVFGFIEGPAPEMSEGIGAVRCCATIYVSICLRARAHAHSLR